MKWFRNLLTVVVDFEDLDANALAAGTPQSRTAASVWVDIIHPILLLNIFQCVPLSDLARYLSFEDELNVS